MQTGMPFGRGLICVPSLVLQMISLLDLTGHVAVDQLPLPSKHPVPCSLLPSQQSLLGYHKSLPLGLSGRAPR